MADEAIVARRLVKRYVTYRRRGFFGKEKVIVRALRGISFDVQKGEVFGLLGPNGAGKTTTVKILSTLLLPDFGEAYVMGYNVVEEPEEVRRRIGVSLSVERGFFWKLTGRENLRYFGMLYGLEGADLRDRIDELLELVGLEQLGASEKLFEEYSLGMKARLSLARALLMDPPVLILDEPTLGLDPPSAKSVREMLVGLAHEEGKAVLMTTHNMFEAEIMCDRVAIINEGRIKAVGTVEELKREVSRRVSIEILAWIPETLSKGQIMLDLMGLCSYPSIIYDEESVSRIKIVAPASTVDMVVSKVLRFLHERRCSVRRVEVAEPTLEDVFIKVTGRSGIRG